MKISIKNLKDRKTFDVDVEPTSTADDVKAAVEKQTGVGKTSQRLVFGGKPLRDDTDDSSTVPVELVSPLPLRSDKDDPESIISPPAVSLAVVLPTTSATSAV